MMHTGDAFCLLPSDTLSRFMHLRRTLENNRSSSQVISFPACSLPQEALLALLFRSDLTAVPPLLQCQLAQVLLTLFSLRPLDLVLESSGVWLSLKSLNVSPFLVISHPRPTKCSKLPSNDCWDLD